MVSLYGIDDIEKELDAVENLKSLLDNIEFDYGWDVMVRLIERDSDSISVIMTLLINNTRVCLNARLFHDGLHDTNDLI